MPSAVLVFLEMTGLFAVVVALSAVCPYFPSLDQSCQVQIHQAQIQVGIQVERDSLWSKSLLLIPP